MSNYPPGAANDPNAPCVQIQDIFIIQQGVKMSSYGWGKQE